MRFIWKILVLWMLGLGVAAIPAQTTAADISARLKGKPLYLRGRWGENKLEFGSDGMPTGNYQSIPFTEAGIDVTSVKLHGDRLEIKGKRIAFTFDAQGMPAQPLKLGNLQVTIAGQPGMDYDKALDTVFAASLADLAPDLPAYWQFYAVKTHLIAPSAETAWIPASEMKKDARPLHVGGAVQPPLLLKSAEPVFSQLARAMKFSGKTMIYLWVEKDGLPSHVSIVRPVGMGLDEQAVAAVEQYRFKPAMRDGSPVTVDLYVEVNFQIF